MSSYLSLLLHSETSDGVIPVWEDCDETSVASVREIMEGKHADSGMTLTFKRLPMTSEKPPDVSLLGKVGGKAEC